MSFKEKYEDFCDGLHAGHGLLICGISAVGMAALIVCGVVSLF